MKYVFQLLISAFGMLTIMSPSTAVEGPPQQLLGKSIVVTWSENRIQRAEGSIIRREFPYMWHNFQLYADLVREATQAVDDIAQFISRNSSIQ